MIGEKLRKFRLKRGLTQQQLASKIIADVRCISNYENNVNIPPLLVLKDICSALQIEFTIANDNIYFKDVKENNKKMKSNLDTNQTILNTTDLDKAPMPQVSMLASSENVIFKDLPGKYNFKVKLDSNANDIKEVVIDKWNSSEYTSIISIITQHIPLPSGMTNSQIEDALLFEDISIDGIGEIIDVFFKEDDIIVMYDCFHEYSDNLTVGNVLTRVDEVGQQMLEKATRRLYNIASQNTRNIQALKNVLNNREPLSLDLVRLLENVDADAKCVFSDKFDCIQIKSVSDMLNNSDLNKFTNIILVGDSAKLLMEILDVEELPDIDEIIYKYKLKKNPDGDIDSLFNLSIEKVVNRQVVTVAFIECCMEKYYRNIDDKLAYIEEVLSDVEGREIYNQEALKKFTNHHRTTLKNNLTRLLYFLDVKIAELSEKLA